MEAKYIDHLGDDLRVVNAARVSFAKESKWEKYWEPHHLEAVEFLSEKDEKLINYLAKHGHWTPFAHPMITLVEKVPIFVARQRFKHMVGFVYNEVSRRYVNDEVEFYVPDEWRSRPDGSIKQGSGTTILKKLKGTIEMYPWGHETETSHLVEIGSRSVGYYSIKKDYEIFLNAAKTMYDHLIKGGVAPEQARMVLPQSMYTEYYVTGSLAAWARAYKQRIDAHAQKEIQDLAKEWDKIIAPLFPVSWKALTE
jgi:thymidylate synthase (FAD)